MEKYVVISEFNDLELGRIRAVGETIDADEERAERLHAAGVVKKSRGDAASNNPDSDGESTESELVHVGSGYYQLPNGEKVRGKDKALEALAALKQSQNDSNEIGNENGSGDEQ